MKKLLLAFIAAFSLAPCLRASDANVSRSRGVTGYVEDTIRPKVTGFNAWMESWKQPSPVAPRPYNPGDYKAPPGSVARRKLDLIEQAEAKQLLRTKIADEKERIALMAEKEAQKELPVESFRDLYEQARDKQAQGSNFNISQEKGFWQGFWPKVRSAFQEPVPSPESMYPTVQPEVPSVKQKQSERLIAWLQGSQSSQPRVKQSERLREWFKEQRARLRAWFEGSPSSGLRTYQQESPKTFEEGVERGVVKRIADAERDKLRAQKKADEAALKVKKAGLEKLEEIRSQGVQPLKEADLGAQLRAEELAKLEAQYAAAYDIGPDELESILAARPSLREQDIAALQEAYDRQQYEALKNERLGALQNAYDRQQFYTKLADEYNKEQDKNWFTRGMHKSPEELEAAFAGTKVYEKLKQDRLKALQKAYAALPEDERMKARQLTYDMLPWYKQVTEYPYESARKARAFIGGKLGTGWEYFKKEPQRMRERGIEREAKEAEEARIAQEKEADYWKARAEE
jgi:hypothetical protein